MKRRYILLAIISLVLTMPAIAQVGPPSREKADNIRRLMTILGAEKMQQNMIDQMMAALKPIFVKNANGDQQVEKMMDRLFQLFSEEFKNADLGNITFDLYDKYFTDDEIKGLIRFYETPIGQKAVQVLPALTQESMTRGMEKGRVVVAKALARLAEEFPAIKGALEAPPRKD